LAFLVRCQDDTAVQEMTKNTRFGVLVVLGLASVWLLTVTCGLLEDRISQIPLIAVVRGAGGVADLGPVGAGLLLCLGSLLTVLAVSGIATLVRPVGLQAVYALLLPLPLALGRGKSKGIAAVAAFLCVSLFFHLCGAATEIRSRIKFSPDSIARWRSVVALALLMVIVFSLYRGGARLISTEGPELQVALEERAAGLIDEQVPRLVDEVFSSERVAEMSKGLPPEADLDDLKREILSHIPRGSEIVERAKEEAPKAVAVLKAELEKTRKAILKGPIISLQNLYLLGVLWTLVGTAALLLGVARIFSGIAGLLTGLVIEFLLRIGVIIKVEEEVALERLSI
jgi:hypothetical protein